MIGVDGALKVLDFGTARFEDAGRTAKNGSDSFRKFEIYVSGNDATVSVETMLRTCTVWDW